MLQTVLLSPLVVGAPQYGGGSSGGHSAPSQAQTSVQCRTENQVRYFLVVNYFWLIERFSGGLGHQVHRDRDPGTQTDRSPVPQHYLLWSFHSSFVKLIVEKSFCHSFIKNFNSFSIFTEMYPKTVL